MQRASSRNTHPAGRSLTAVVLGTTVLSSYALAEPHVEFDFARTAECRDVTPFERFEQYPNQRLIEFALSVSVRFRDVPLDDVDELTVEINAAVAGLRIHGFSPATQLASDVACEIVTTTTTNSARSFDATLGGQLPVPFGEVVAHATPSFNAGLSNGETTTEKLNRLPPKHAVVVSGTSSEGRGVFFKLKRTSQTSLEGVHDLAVTFVAPAGWRGGDVRVACNAQGQRKVLWIKQEATLGCEGDMVRLYLAGRGRPRTVAKPVIVESPKIGRQASALDTVSADVVGTIDDAHRGPPTWIEKFTVKTKPGEWINKPQAAERSAERPEDRDQQDRYDPQNQVQSAPTRKKSPKRYPPGP